jgi:histidinol-phosphate aminotransferase/threonine-phosphate decarboxylase
VVRTLTKLYGLPGFRAGYAVATGDHRKRLAATRLPWSLGGPATAVGTYCLDQPEFVERTRERIATERERIRERLETRFDVAPSRAPFFLLDLGSGETVEELCDSLRAEDIVIRDARSFRGLDSHVRVAVRRPDENDRLLDAIGV